MNKMKEIRIEKVTLNIGAGKDQKVLEKGIKLITNLTGTAPVKTITNKRLQAWGLRPGLPVGCKLTLRGEKAEKIIPRLIHAKDNILKETYFDNHGNVSFGLPEYMEIKDAKYDPEIGMMGLQATITLTRPGFRIRNKKIRPAKISRHHQIKQAEAINFMKEKYSIKIGERE
jgi:large subunit ribosomal protein L5